MDNRSSNGGQLKKTVRFDADDELDDGLPLDVHETFDLGWTTLGQDSEWPCLGRQESRESTARDSGVDTLTSGEEVISNSVFPYDIQLKVCPHKKSNLVRQTKGIIIYIIYAHV